MPVEYADIILAVAALIAAAAVMRPAPRPRAASARSLADLGGAAAGATCRRGPDMGLADAGATARLGPCAFVGRTGRAAARVAPGRRAGTVMGSPPGSSPILGRAAGWGSRRTSRPFGAVVESARRAPPGASARRSRAPTLEFAGAGLVGRGSSG